MAFRIVSSPEYSADEVKALIDLRSLLASDQVIREDKPVKMRCLWHQEEDPSLYVWPDHLHCYGCGTHMDLIDYVAWREGLDGVEWEFERVLTVAAEKYVGLVPPPPVVVERPKIELGPMAAEVAEAMYRRLGARRQWFRDRGLSDETIDRERLGYDRRAFVIPVWSDSGDLLTVRYRRDDEASSGRGPKYWGVRGRNGPMLYNARALELVGEWGWVAVCEGELDALRLYQEGVPAVSATNGAGALDVALAEQINRSGPSLVYVVYDQDEAGHANGIRVARLFGLKGRVLRWPFSWGKDVTEFLQARRIEEFVGRLLEQAVPERSEPYCHGTLKNGVWR